MARRPVRREERRALEALHEATGELLAAEDVAQAYFARVKVSNAMNALLDVSRAARDREKARA